MKPAVALLGGYLCLYLMLPIASFSPIRDDPAAWLYVVGNALDSNNPLNRDAVLGVLLMSFAVAIAVGLRYRTRWNWLDALLGVWIATPLLAGLFNPSGLASDTFQSLYLAVVWGGPYLAGRLLVRDQSDLIGCLGVVVASGLVSAVLGITELLFGRFFYQLLYGFHPNQGVGDVKFFGTRPLLCFEDPNQIGMWWMTVALCAAILIPAWYGRHSRPLAKYASLALPFLFQGVGASLLTLAGVLGLTARFKVRWKYALIGLAVIAGVLFAMRGPLLRVSRQVLQEAGLEQKIKQYYRDSPIGSLGWRALREEEGSKTLEQFAWFGRGTVLFWEDDPAKYRPWGFVSLVQGTYGVLGVTTALSLFFMPLAYCVWNSADFFSGRLAYGVSLLWALHGVDALINPALLLPMLFLLGGSLARLP